MIRLVEGLPGSGKSYFAMNYLCKFCEWDDLYEAWVLKPGVLVISNLEDLKIQHRDLDKILRERTIEEFFTVENFEKIQAQYKCTNIILIVDEAQKKFDSKFYDKEVFYFFQYHRHLGLDIFLMTQTRTSIARQLIPLCEYIIAAQPRSKGFYGTMRYKYLDCKGQHLYHKVLKTNPKIFRSYKSFKADEFEKPKNLLNRYLIMIAVVLIVFVFVLKNIFAFYKTDSRKAVKGEKDKKAVSSQTQSSPVQSSVGPGSSVPGQSVSAVHPSQPVPANQPVSVSQPVDNNVSPSDVPPTVPVDRVVEIDGIVKANNSIYLTLKGYPGSYKLPHRDILRIDWGQRTAIMRSTRAPAEQWTAPGAIPRAVSPGISGAGQAGAVAPASTAPAGDSQGSLSPLGNVQHHRDPLKPEHPALAVVNKR